ncbi:hypothetical protein [Mucilaginibacter sp. OK268]|jgi:hypothetical protein|uniref:hypothetical protein n=1 Tax=Mucilaginibacter sp. OK268 TaxID=1881048 RepID=UPI0015A34117|nr:hypothetical protein [Mucilaginibacter sp. OK268]
MFTKNRIFRPAEGEIYTKPMISSTKDPAKQRLAEKAGEWVADTVNKVPVMHTFF